MTINTPEQLPRLTPGALTFSPETFQNSLLAWYQSHNRQWPWRQLWEERGDIYPVWVSEIMLQQTVIKAVLPVYARFLKAFPTVQDLANASSDEVRTAVRGLGYYRRFGFMHQTAQVICHERGGKWPTTLADWLKLPGIGAYTGAAITSITLGQANPVLDGNVERVFARLFDVRLPANLPAYKKALQPILQTLISHKSPGDFNQAVMELGQDVCTKAAEPDCGHCPVSDYCQAWKHGSISLAPQAKPKAEPVLVPMRLTVWHRGKEIALVRRSKVDKFLKETEGFYTEHGESLSPKGSGKLVGEFSHSITKHRLTVEVYAQAFQAGKSQDDIRWVKSSQVEKNLLANLDRKGWKLVQKHLKNLPPQ